MNISSRYLVLELANKVACNINCSSYCYIQVVKFSSSIKIRTLSPVPAFSKTSNISVLSRHNKDHITTLELYRQHQPRNPLIQQTNYLSMVKLKSFERPTANKSHPLTLAGGSHNRTLKSSSSLKSLKSLSSGFKMKVLPVKALQDNYMYLLIDEATKQAAAVDPVNASAMANTVSEQGVELKAILTTHHHYDHAHGNADMLSMFPDLTIYGGDNRVQALNKLVINADVIKLGTLSIECLSTPCHTRGHICYYVTCNDQDSASDPSPNEHVVFTGDTLFIAGCGRFFEGSSEQMDRNLNTVLGNLPDDTKVYCGHEYTVTNLKFALSVEPQNTDIKSKLVWAQNKVSKREPTVPSTIGEEKRINPFMRLKRPQVKKYTGEEEELEVMTVLRQRKNEFQA